MEHVDRIVGVIFVLLGVLGFVAGFYAGRPRSDAADRSLLDSPVLIP